MRQGLGFSDCPIGGHMKLFYSLLTVSLLFSGTNGVAHHFEKLTQSKDATLEQVMKAEKAFEQTMSLQEKNNNEPESTAYAAYHVTEAAHKAVGKKAKSKRRGKKETDLQMYTRIVKNALHKDYPITGDDGGYNLVVMKTVEEIKKDIPYPFTAEEDGPAKEAKALLEALEKAEKENLPVLIGTGSGNNTMADIVIVIDPNKKDKTQFDFAYLISSNFGSDD